MVENGVEGRKSDGKIPSSKVGVFWGKYMNEL